MLGLKVPHDRFENAKRYDDCLKDVEIPESDNLHHQPAPGFGSVATRGANDRLVHRMGTFISKRHPVRNHGPDFEVDPKILDKEYARQACQNHPKHYFCCVKSVDEDLARLFDCLKKNDLFDNTVIIYTGDQAMMLREHDYMNRRWRNDELMRMPFLFCYPKLVKAGSKNEMLVNNAHFAPTIQPALNWMAAGLGAGFRRQAIPSF